MKKKIYQGACTALITPFTPTGTVDFAKIAELVEFQIANGIDAIAPCATTGEAPTLIDEEHIEVIKTVVQQVNKRVPVIAGTGSNDTHHAIALSKAAQKAGADAVLSVNPYYNKTSQKGLIAHFTDIAKSIDIPIILYNIPARVNYNMTPATMGELAKIENIVGVKECNAAQAGEVRNYTGEDFLIVSGDDNAVLPILSLGGNGCISTAGNIIPKQMHDMVAKYLTGDNKGATEIQLKILDLINSLFIEVNPMPIKAAMNIMGMNVGKCRLPLVDVEPQTIATLTKTLEHYGLVKK